MATDPHDRKVPTRAAALRATSPTTAQARPGPSLLIWGPRDDLRINLRHPAGVPVALLYALAAPLLAALNAAALAHRWWASREERAALRRAGLLRR